MVRRFLNIVAAITVLVIVAGFALYIWWDRAADFAFVPSQEFVEQDAFAQNAYQDPAMWFSRPGIGVDDPARWQPALREEERTSPALPEQQPGDFAVFFIHPTSYFERANWNAPIDHAESQRIARIYVRGMASPFNQASEIWAPRYRQATFGAFLTDAPEGQRAIDAGYRDVRQAFEYFLSSIAPDTPIVLAGHSQGALHLLRLLREEVAASAAAPRIAAVYAVGWPISVDHDLPGLGFPACATATQPGCVMSWSSFAEPADPRRLLETYRESLAPNGEPRGDSAILCTNPLTGMVGGAAAADANLGTLIPDAGYTTGELVPGAVPARCDERGLLLIGDPPEVGDAVLPGNNYHVYDIPLFWRNLQRDVANRVEAWRTAR
ncbi:DUF3089 domain-containing protein [Leptolyngbya sp. 15MV]|nr:DUF3089 domain-containing protein [Leptolyngbya sp. 15MV]